MRVFIKEAKRLRNKQAQFRLKSMKFIFNN